MGSGPTDPSEPYFDKGGWGFDGTVWRRLGLVWAYYAVVVENKQNLDCSEGINTLTTTVVPAGSVHHLYNIAVRNVNNACSAINVFATIGGINVPVIDQRTPVAGVWDIWSGDIVLGYEDGITAEFFDCVLNDNIYLRIGGYEMRVNL